MHSLVATSDPLFDAIPEVRRWLRCLRAARDTFERVEVLLIRVGEGVQVLLGGLNLCMTQAIHDALQIRAAGEQPGCVRMTEVVDAHGEVDTAGRDCRKPPVPESQGGGRIATGTPPATAGSPPAAPNPD